MCVYIYFGRVCHEEGEITLCAGAEEEFDNRRVSGVSLVMRSSGFVEKSWLKRESSIATIRRYTRLREKYTDTQNSQSINIRVQPDSGLIEASRRKTSSRSSLSATTSRTTHIYEIERARANKNFQFQITHIELCIVRPSLFCLSLPLQRWRRCFLCSRLFAEISPICLTACATVTKYKPEGEANTCSEDVWDNKQRQSDD